MTAPPTHHTRSEVFAEPPLACLVLTLVPYIAGLKTPNQGLRPFAKGNAWTPSLLLQVLQVGYPCRPVTGTQLTWIPYKILELYDDDAAEDYLRVVYITGQRLDMLIKVASLFALFFPTGRGGLGGCLKDIKVARMEADLRSCGREKGSQKLWNSFVEFFQEAGGSSKSNDGHNFLKWSLHTLETFGT